MKRVRRMARVLLPGSRNLPAGQAANPARQSLRAALQAGMTIGSPFEYWS